MVGRLAVGLLAQRKRAVILVNNAGVQRRLGLDEFDHDDRHEVMRTNIDSVFYVSQTVARHMIARTRQSHQHRQGSKRTRAPDHGAVCGVEGRRQEPDASWAPIGRRWGCR
jgi:NADP-dependent 3-hydroxy acid dehydrogenase YdfG